VALTDWTVNLARRMLCVSSHKTSTTCAGAQVSDLLTAGEFPERKRAHARKSQRCIDAPQDTEEADVQVDIEKKGNQKL
jgi:hypothetical protein